MPARGQGPTEQERLCQMGPSGTAVRRVEAIQCIAAPPPATRQAHRPSRDASTEWAPSCSPRRRWSPLSGVEAGPSHRGAGHRPVPLRSMDDTRWSVQGPPTRWPPLDTPTPACAAGTRRWRTVDPAVDGTSSTQPDRGAANTPPRPGAGLGTPSGPCSPPLTSFAPWLLRPLTASPPPLDDGPPRMAFPLDHATGQGETPEATPTSAGADLMG